MIIRREYDCIFRLLFSRNTRLNKYLNVVDDSSHISLSEYAQIAGLTAFLSFSVSEGCFAMASISA